MIARYENCMGKLQLFLSMNTFICETWLALCYFFFLFQLFNFPRLNNFGELNGNASSHGRMQHKNKRLGIERSAKNSSPLDVDWKRNENEEKISWSFKWWKENKIYTMQRRRSFKPKPWASASLSSRKMKRRKNLQWNSNNKPEPKRFVYTAQREYTRAQERRRERRLTRAELRRAEREMEVTLDSQRAIWGDAETERSPPPSSHTVENSRESRACLRSSVKPPTRSLYAVCDMLSEKRIETLVEWMKVNGRRWASLTNIVVAAVQPLQLSTRCYSLLIHFIRLLRWILYCTLNFSISHAGSCWIVFIFVITDADGVWKMNAIVG